MRKIIVGAVLGCLCLSATNALAVENHVQSTPTDVFFFGSGFTPPPSEFGTFGIRNAYGNSAGIGEAGTGLGGVKPAIQSKVSANVTTLSWVYMTHYQFLGASYGIVVVQPFFDFNGGIKGNVYVPHVPFPVASVDVRNHITGFGATQIYPILLQWLDLPHLAVNASVAVQFPDGRYSKNALLNPGNNYWTVLPNIGATYISNYGQEVSTYDEVDFNTTNKATHYHSGTEFKMAVAAGQHLGNFAVGPAGYYYQQLENDTGSGTRVPGANPDAARVFGAGLAFDFTPRGKRYAMFGSFIKEFEARNHSQGFDASLRIAYAF